MPILVSLFARWGASAGLSRVLGFVVPLGLAALVLGLLWARGTHYEDQRDTARAQVEAVNAKLAVSNASIDTLQKSLATYVGAGKAAKVAQLGAVEAQAKDNAALQGQADAIRQEMANLPAGKCATPASIKGAKGL